MNYKDGITINGKHSYNDFGLYVAERNIGIPAKKVIKKTIPYMNGAYDFTMLNGVPAYEERPITYGFDITGATVEEMEAEKASVLAWLYMAQDVDIFDDAYPETHFRGSYVSDSWDEDGCQGHLTVVFEVYPFRISNHDKGVTFTAASSTKLAVNNGLPVKMILNADQGATVVYGGYKYSVSSGEYRLPYVLPSGSSEITVTQPAGAITKIVWREEVI